MSPDQSQSERDRAARWDGACFYRAVASGSIEDSGVGLAPDEIADVKRFVDEHRAAADRFDIMVEGLRGGADADQERQRLRQSAEVGATWRQQWITPADYGIMRAFIECGPFRIG